MTNPEFKNKYKATIIGFIFSVICFAATWTFIVPILTIIPLALPLELLFSNSNYSTTATGVLLTLIGLFMGTTYWFYRLIIKDKKEKHKFNTIRLIGFYSILLFIVHPIVFYIWASMNSSNAGDGQFIFGIMETFPVSSWTFVILGLLIDLVKNEETNIC